MRKVLFVSLALAALLGASSVWAEDAPVKFKSTGEGEVHTETGYAPSDPLQGKPVNKQWDAGHPSTQAPYDENCKEDRCIRAKQRQLGTTTWEEDRASGLHKTPGKTTPEAGSAPATTTTTTKPATPSTPATGWKPE